MYKINLHKSLTVITIEINVGPVIIPNEKYSYQ